MKAFSFIGLLFLLISVQAQHKPEVKPFVLGRVEQLHSNILNEDRTLNIYLPEGYKAEDSLRYPVIYLLDGSADEDFIHVVGLVQFCSFDWILQVPKSIVVGIANVDRKRDFTGPSAVESERQRHPSSGHSDKFISFIEKELQPYIRSGFKTNGVRTLIGQSLGGLLATEILLTRPQLFEKYVIISPSLWWDNGSMLKRDASALNNLQLMVYLGVGKEGLTPTKEPRVMEVDANVLADQLRSLKNSQLTLYFDYLPEENHATIMHQALMNAFRKIYRQK